MVLRRLGLIFTAILAVSASLPTTSASADTGTITGQLVDGDSGNNAPAVGVTVQACAGGSCSGSAVSDQNGNYTLTGIPANTWSVVTFPQNTPCGANDFARSQASGVTVGAGQTVTAPTIILTRAKGSIAGNVVDASNPSQGIAGVSIFADNSEQGGNGYQGATTGADGSYLLDCLPAQRGYFITATPPSPFVHQADSQFTVTAGQTLQHTMRLQHGNAAMYGRVTCGGPQGCSPPPSILVLEFCGLQSTGSSNPCALANVTPDANGYWSTPSNSLVGGNYTVHIFAPPGWDNAARFNIPVASHTAAGPINMDLAQNGATHSGQIVGHVTDSAGAPYANCRVNMFDQQGQPAGSYRGQGFLTGATTDANGNYATGFTLTPNPNGWYRVWLDCPGHDEVTSNIDANGFRLSPQAGQIEAVNFFWPEPPRPFTGGDTAIGASQPGTDAYFAEGFTGLSGGLAFHEYLTVQNPNNFSEPLAVDYLLASGSVVTKNYTLGASSRTTINVNADVGPNQEVSAHLHTPPAVSPAPPNTFVAERPMYFYFPGGITGGDDVVGAQSLASTYYFAEGNTFSGFHEYLTVMNPSTTAMTIDITYFYSDGSAPYTVTRTIGPTTRATYDVNGTTDGVGPGKAISVEVSSTAHGSPLFLAERPMYFNALGVNGGNDVIGATTLSATGNLAEGNTFSFNQEFLTVLSAGMPATATTTATTPCTSLDITYLYGDGTAKKTVNEPLTANARTTFHVNDGSQAGSGHPVSVHLACHDGVGTFLAERPMYFTLFGDDGGSDAIAVPDSAQSQSVYFAEGFTGFHEFITVLNYNGTPTSSAPASVTYYFADGTTKQVLYSFPPNSRTTINVNNDVGNGKPVSALIDTSASGLSVLAERPMYFAY